MTSDFQALHDRLAIEDLMSRYSLAIDTGRHDDLDDVFTSDAHIDYTEMGGPAWTYPEIKQWLASTLPMFTALLHINANPLVSVTGDTATARTICFTPMQFDSPDQKSRVLFCGLWYHDEFARTDRGWRITRRREEKCVDATVAVT